jgi:hypothetical protein
MSDSDFQDWWKYYERNAAKSDKPPDVELARSAYTAGLERGVYNATQAAQLLTGIEGIKEAMAAIAKVLESTAACSEDKP